MKYIDRKGNITIEENEQDKFLRHLYNDRGGRLCLKLLIRPFVSKAAGVLLNTRLSARFVPDFVKNNKIDLSIYEKQNFSSWNDFFIRRIRKEERPVDMRENILISPCDGKLSVHRISSDSRFSIKDTEYTAEGIPVLTANKAFVLGYTSEINGIYDKGDCIIFDDFTLDCKYVDFPFKVKSSAIKILTAKNKELLRYTFEFLKYLDLSTEEHKRHYIAEIQNQEFILPTMHIVSTIAHAFSALSLRMESVVKQRNMFETQKQYLLRQMFI